MYEDDSPEAATPLVGDRQADIHLSNHLILMLGDINEAILLSRLSDWILSNKRRQSWRHHKDGLWWTYGSLHYWQQTTFTYWSVDTLKRTINRLVKKGLVVKGEHNRMRRDRTRWYAVDFAELRYQYKAFLREGRHLGNSQMEDVDGSTGH